MTEAASLADQIKEVEREIAQRVKVYPRWIEGGRMTPAAAARQMDRIGAVLATLKLCQAGTPPQPDPPPPQGALI